MEIKEQIINDINNNPIMLFMKGTPEMPMCGFSNTVVQVLDHYGVEYQSMNVLTDPEIRVKLSEYSNWPTIPQLFVNGELVGGADITIELHEKGQLLDILDDAGEKAE
ncbi:MAG: Grx4 family monothiol glutaredoxin [Fidelibacterota bacterium]